jgi:superfamily I DNA and RNA helicase
MSESNCFVMLKKEAALSEYIEVIKNYSESNNKQFYLIDRPLGEKVYEYGYENSFLILSPRHKIIFVDFGGNADKFEEFKEDFIEDISSLSDKYRYKEVIGRARSWNDLIVSIKIDALKNIEKILNDSFIEDKKVQRKGELLISLLTGSINDIEKVSVDFPETLLDKVKKKIVLFDGDQTRFIYSKPEKKEIRIQGLSGTGKTELLLHKLKELYVGKEQSKIAFTCHNKILSDSLRKRIPEFFDFMKVEQQILWNERLFCVHAWGGQYRSDSGIYRYICHKYNIQFRSYSYQFNFDDVCNLAIKELSSIQSIEPIFDYMLIDESQDFPESFFTLCSMVTRDTIYIAGDIFQSIFDENIVASIQTDFLLSRCYRTDPRTLMFAHAVGMGLFESKKLRWLEDDEWEKCGYLIDKHTASRTYRLSREPLRRFEDIDQGKFPSVEIRTVGRDFVSSASSSVVEIVKEIFKENPSASVDDIGVIILDSNKQSYAFADSLALMLHRELGLLCNKAYESKQRVSGLLFISNKNNVKGLEFPFVICVTECILPSYSYRNAAYMTLTRSFIKTYFIHSEITPKDLQSRLDSGLKQINSYGYMEVVEPSELEKKKIKTDIKQLKKKVSLQEALSSILMEFKASPDERTKILSMAGAAFPEGSDILKLREFVEVNLNIFRGMMK